jgi:protein SCO1/2
MKRSRFETLSPRGAGRVLGIVAALLLASVGAGAQTTNEQHHPPHPSGGHVTSHDHHAKPSAPDDGVETAAPEELIRLNRVALAVPETEVLDQDGRRLRFHADLVKDKVTVVSFIYTTCLYICTTQGKRLANLRDALGERFGREVSLISVSVDPETDTPDKLKRWGATFGAKSGWTFVTGAKASLEGLRKAFPGVRAGGDMHDPVIFIGNDASGLWVRADALRPTKELLALIDAVAASRKDSGAAPSMMK